MPRNPCPVPTLCWRCQRQPAVKGGRCEPCEKRAESIRRNEGRLIPGDSGFVATNDIELARHRRRCRERYSFAIRE